MHGRIGCITFDCDDPEALASFYAALLLMPTRVLSTDSRVELAGPTGPRLAFAAVPDYRRPTWPDPTYPQQLHLDIPVLDAASTEGLVVARGGTRLPHLGGGCPVYADPAGHPFCLCTNPTVAQGRELPGLVGNVVFDCFTSPRTLASFYAGLLGKHQRMQDHEGWVVIIGTDGRLPRLAFQGADGQPARWPDPERPQQIHLDLEVDDLAAAETFVRQQGGSTLHRSSSTQTIYADPEGHPFCLRSAA